ncbi:DNA-binding protein BIN4 [Sesamum angolense]|uniref:DNA-binding protein BIN4 n=1 Tax=Sesamum angolense TaxID=2727404 RepID=A0AAE1VZ64_9LAMI|nr:DNA-binding protein BIN4 [Sesamum angolense]
MDVFTIVKLPSLFVCTEPPTQSAIELSSGSESPLDGSPAISDDDDAINLSKLFKKEAKQASDTNHKDYMTVAVVNKPVEGKSPKENDKVKPKPERKRQNEDESEREGKRVKRKDTNMISGTQKLGKSHEQSHSIWSLSSDSESSPDTQPVNNDKASKGELSANEEDLATKNIREIDNILVDHDGEPPMNRVSTVKSPMKNLEKEDEKTSKKKNTNISINGENDVKEDSSRKHPGLQGSSSRLPLLLSEKVQRSKALVECEGDSIDLSGDVGSVGRIVVSDDPSKNHEMFLDLKGMNHIQNNHSFIKDILCGKLGQSEAKIEAIMNDYIQLKPQSNVYEAETMVEGTLDGFSFDSEDENEKSIAQADQHEAAEEQPDGKSKRKPDKTSIPLVDCIVISISLAVPLCKNKGVQMYQVRHKNRVKRRTNIDTGKGNRMVEDEAVADVFPLRLSPTSGARNPPSILLILHYVNDFINFIIVMNWDAGTVMTLHHITTGREKQEIEI